MSLVIGCDYLRQRLPGFKREHGVDMVIANGEKFGCGERYIAEISSIFI